MGYYWPVRHDTAVGAVGQLLRAAQHTPAADVPHTVKSCGMSVTLSLLDE